MNLTLEKAARNRLLGDRLSENSSLNRNVRKRNYASSDQRNPLISAENGIMDLNDSHHSYV